MDTGNNSVRQLTNVTGADIVRIGPYRVRLSAREVFQGDQSIELSWRSFEALRILIEANGAIVERDTLFSALWPGVQVGESSLNQCIAKLRKELDEPADGHVIATVPRRGYRLSEPPQVVQPAVENRAAELSEKSFSQPEPRQLRRRILISLSAVTVLVVLVVGYAWPRWSRRAQARSLTEQGFRAMRQNPVQGLAAASELFRQAIDFDPYWALAYAGLAEVMARKIDGSRDEAAAMAERSMRMDPRCSRCQAIAGFILITRQWRFRDGAAALDRALALDPHDPRILLWHAQMMASSGHLERALAEIEQARTLDFKDPGVAAMRSGILYLSGRYEEAIRAGRDALGLKPDLSSAYEWIYRSHLRLNQVSQALYARASMNAAFVQLTPESRYEEEHRWMDAYGSGGLPKLVNVLLAANAAKPALDHQRYERATWKMWNGDGQGALDELEHVFDFRPFNTIYTAVDPTFAPLHGEKRFRELLSRIGLDTLARPHGSQLSTTR